jgi:hypothetical protein
MATLATLALTLADWAARLDPGGNIPEIAELLTQTNAILQDAVFMEGNLADRPPRDRAHRPAHRLLARPERRRADQQVHHGHGG